MKLKNVNVWILHHLDKDGVLSGFWCMKWFLENFTTHHDDKCAIDATCGINYDIHPIQVNYGIDPYSYFGDDVVTDSDIIFLVDFSFPPDVMRDLYYKTEKIIWVDHHISVLNKFNECGDDLLKLIPGIRSTAKAACELTYNYLFSEWEGKERWFSVDDDLPFYSYGIMNESKAIELNDIPIAGKYVASADLFDFSDKNTKPFVYGCKAFDISTIDGYNYISSLMCGEASGSATITAINKGNVIIEYRQNVLNPDMMKSAQEVRIITNNDSPLAEEISNLKCIALNMPGCFNSEVFGEKRDEYDACIKYHRTSRGWSYTVYTIEKSPLRSYDIVSYFGGGGHPHAGGFQTEELALEFISR